MISRYTDPEMAGVWTDQNRFEKWLDVEISVSEVLAELGEIPTEAALKIRKNASFSLERIYEVEKETHHDVVAFTTAVAETLGPESRFVHLGLTSTDVVDTAQALQLRQACGLIEGVLNDLLGTLRQKALEYQDTLMMGRTHGIHAEPTSLGLKMTVWYCEMERNLKRFRLARQAVEIGKISGPVGTFSHLSPRVEEMVCEKLGLGFAKASTQTLQRDRHAEFACTLAIIGSTYEKIATEIRHLQRTEVGEVGEPFATGQKGSSSMPHKRNPIGSENISGLSRVLRSNAMVALQNIPLWHERDISHSSAERIILPDSTTLLHYMTIRLTKILRNLVVHSKRMQQNLEMTGGLFHSSALLLALVRKGALREDAYSWVQRNAMLVWDEGADFFQVIANDPDISKYLTKDEIVSIFDPRTRLRHLPDVYARVFGN
jgi:adenylosuccinate lyase